jgi:hypothetical protein
MGRWRRVLHGLAGAAGIMAPGAGLVFGWPGWVRRGFSDPLPRGEHEVGQPEEDVQLVLVLGQAPIPRLPVAEEVLHDVKGVFDEGPHLGLGFLQCLESLLLRAFGHRFDRASFAGDLPVDLPFQGHNLFALVHAHVAGVGVDLRLLAVQQRRRLADVGHVRRRGHDGVDQAAVPVRADVGLPPEVPLVALLIWCISGSRVRSRFFVELGAAMRLASTNVPSHSSKPRAA